MRKGISIQKSFSGTSAAQPSNVSILPTVKILC